MIDGAAITTLSEPGEWIIEFFGLGSLAWISSSHNLPKTVHGSENKHDLCSLEYGLERLRTMAMESGPQYRIRNVNTNEVIPMEIFT